MFERNDFTGAPLAALPLEDVDAASGALFCCGGPPERVEAAIAGKLIRAALRRAGGSVERGFLGTA